MAAPRFGEWRFWEEGAAPEGLLPAAYVQYRWTVHEEFLPSPVWLGLGGGMLPMTFELEFSAGGEVVLASEDFVEFLCITLEDPFIMGLVNLYTYHPNRMTTTGPETYPTFGGPQLDWQYTAPSTGMGIYQVWVIGLLVSPVYQVDLPAGTTLDALHWFPCSGVPSPGWALEVRTAPGGRPEKVLIVDHQSGNQTSFRIHGDILLARTWLSGYRTYDGPRTGLAVTAGTGLSVDVSAGEAYLGHRPCSMAEAATVELTGAATNHVWARALTGGPPVPLEVLATTGEEIPDGQPCLLAIVSCSGTEVTGVEEVPGSVVAFDVTSCGGQRTESGRMVVTVDRDSETDVRYASGDGGLTWGRAT